MTREQKKQKKRVSSSFRDWKQALLSTAPLSQHSKQHVKWLTAADGQVLLWGSAENKNYWPSCPSGLPIGDTW